MPPPEQKNMIFYRKRAMDDKKDTMGEDGTCRLLVSTQEAVDWGGWREILVHSEGSINLDSARSLLINHNANQLAGRISGAKVADGQLEMDAMIDADARMQSGVGVRKAVKEGYLRGVSVGYTYRQQDTHWDEATRTLTVNKWRALEASLTPIPADERAQVRALPFNVSPASEKPGQQPNERDMTMKFEAWLKARGYDAAKLSEADSTKLRAIFEAGGEPPADFAPHALVIDEAARAQEMAATREELARLKIENKIRATADAHKISTDGLDFGSFKSEADGLTELLKRKASTDKATNPVGPVVQVGRDAADKWFEGVGKGLMGERDGMHLSNEQIIRRCAAIDGEHEQDMSYDELISLSLRRMSWKGSKRDAANKTTSSFSTLVGNTANKMLLNGFDAYAAIFSAICTIKDAKDYNSHPHVGVATGRLTETPENTAFQELFQKEGSYSTQLKMYGATLRITEQTLVNDSLGEIMRSFFKTGYIAGRTIDREVFSKLLNATWTNDNTASAPLGTAGNLDKVRADFKKKLSPSGEKMENDPFILVVDPLLRFAAETATGQLYGIGAGAGNSQVGSNALRGLSVVDSTFVGDTGLYGSALTTDYFLFGRPNIVDTVTVEFLNGQRVPVIAPFDAGAVAAVAMMIKLPFVAAVASHTDSAGNVRISGIQRGQA